MNILKTNATLLFSAYQTGACFNTQSRSLQQQDINPQLTGNNYVSVKIFFKSHVYTKFFKIIAIKQLLIIYIYDDTGMPHSELTYI